MNTNSKLNFLRCGTAPMVLGIALLAGASGALAQQATPAPGANAPAPIDTPSAGANGGDEIVVTGTRITNRPDLKSASPIASVTAETLAVTNSNTVESYLTQLPEFVASVGSATNNGASGEANVDLRGLGPARTLVLLDGKRMVPGDITGPVDVDAIPTVMIKRVDVLTGGASTVYGADAVAGVVNFVLDDTFVGVAGDAATQITNYGDGMQTNIDGKIGLKLPNDGHLVIGGQYTHRDGVYQSARGFSEQNLDSGSLLPTGSSYANPTVISINSGRYQLNSAGTFTPGVSQPYNYNPANYFVTPLDKWTVMALFQQPISDNVSMYIHASYTHSEVVATLAPTATGGFNFTVSPNNPYLLANPANYALIFGDPSNLNADGTANVAISRRITEGGGRVETWKTDTKYIVGGFKGSLGSKFNWEVFGQYGSNDRNATFANDLSYTRTEQAVNAVTGANGTVQCADPSGGCVPLNLFSTTPISAASLAYVSADGHEQNHYEQEIGGGSITGTLDALKSPFADNGAAIAVGVEYRREQGSQTVDAAYGSGDLIFYGQGTDVPSASFNVKEVYGELKMPLITDKPFFKELGLEGGIRYSAYTNHTTGGTNKNNELTYKFGGDWTPVEGIRFRALYNRAIRDPNVNELNQPLTQAGTDNINSDPCAGVPGANGAIIAPTAAIQKICVAQGAPAALVASGGVQNVVVGQVNLLSGGNPELSPEKASTITLGAVISPPSMRNFHLTVDYYHIKIADYISSLNAQQIVSGCFGGQSDLCGLIVRNTITGELTGSVEAGVEERLINVAQLKTSGIDVTTDYKFRFSHDSSLTLAMAGTYILNWNFYNAGAVTSCAGHYGNACSFLDSGTGPQGAPMPKWKHIVSATYQNGPFTFYGAWRLIGSVTEDPVDFAANAVAGTPLAVYRVPSYSYFDATAGFDVTENYKLRIGVKNMFNIDPPIVGGNSASTGVNSGNTFPTVYDPLGRTFFASLGIKF
jgi:iron complex outermembrane receptor protein